MSTPKRRIRIQLVAIDPSKDELGVALAKTRQDAAEAIEELGLRSASAGGLGNGGNDNWNKRTGSDDDDGDRFEFTPEDGFLQNRIEQSATSILDEISKAAGDFTAALSIAARASKEATERFVDTVNRESEIAKANLITTAVRGFVEIKSRTDPWVTSTASWAYGKKDQVFVGVFIVKIAERIP